VKNDDRTNLERLSGDLVVHYEQHGSWDGMLPVLNRPSSISGKQVILADRNQGLVAVAPSALRDLSISIHARRNLQLERRTPFEERACNSMTDAMVRTEELRCNLIRK